MPTSLGQAKRAARIRKVVEETMERRALGEELPDAMVAAANPDLMPALAEELKVLAVLERARARVVSSSRVGSSTGSSRALALGPPVGEPWEGGYRIVGEVHRGGQGVVYEAIQEETGRRVAIKVMKDGLFAGDRDSARFEQEVRILGQLDHPGIVRVLGSGVRAGHFYYIMDFVQGTPLDEYVGGPPPGGLAIRDRVEVLERICDAVSGAHLRGIIHRDLKPGNILVDGEGRPRILDFGLARVIAAGPLAAAMTITGQFVGSMPWASPEQAAGDPRKIDLRTDVYSLGVLLYQALTGRFPYAVEGPPRDVLDRIMNASPSRPRSVARGLDEDIEAILLKCLAKERERRYQSAGELAEELRRYLAGRPILARPPSTAYQLRAFARRNKALVLGSLATIAAMLLGLIGTSAGLVQASAGRHEAELGRDAARAAESVAQQKRREAERLAYSASIAAADSALQSEDASTAQARLQGAPEDLRGWEWRLLRTLSDQSERTLPIPPALCAAVSPDGSSLAVLGADRTLSLLSYPALGERWRAPLPAPGQDAPEQKVARFSADGLLLATVHGSWVLVWDARTGALLHRFEIPDSTWGWADAAFRPGGQHLAVGRREGRLMIWDMQSGTALPAAQNLGQVGGFGGLDYSADGRTLAVGIAGAVLMVDADTFRPVRRLEFPESAQAGWGPVRFSHDGNLLAGAPGMGVALFDLRTGEARTLSGHRQRAEIVSFSPDDSLLASAGWDRTTRLWRTATGEPERTLLGHAGEVLSVDFVPGGRQIVTSAADRLIKVWSPEPRPNPAVITLSSRIWNLSFGAGPTILASGHAESKLWDVSANREVQTPPRLGAKAVAAAISPDGRRIAYDEGDGVLALWEIDGSREVWRAPPAGGWLTSLEFAAGGTRILASTIEHVVRAYAASDGSLLFESDRLPTPALRLSPSPDGARIITGAPNDGVIVLDGQTGRTITSQSDPHAPGKARLCTDHSPDGSLIAMGNTEGQVVLFEARGLRPVRILTGMNPAVWSVRFSPDGKRLAAGSQDRTTRIWDVATGDELLVLRGHRGTVIEIAWSPDGRYLATGSFDGTVMVWDAGPLSAPSKAAGGELKGF